MDIRLQASKYLLIFRVTLVLLAMTAVLASEVHELFAVLLLAAACLQLLAFVCERDPVRNLYINDEQNPSEKDQQRKVILQLRSGRRIEMTLKHFYCLWWLQILYLNSSHHAEVLVILPDSSTADDRRRLRQALYR